MYIHIYIYRTDFVNISAIFMNSFYKSYFSISAGLDRIVCGRTHFERFTM